VKGLGLILLLGTVCASVLIRFYAWAGYQFIRLPVVDPAVSGINVDQVERTELVQCEIWLECFALSCLLLLLLRLAWRAFASSRGRARYGRPFR
jgi:hypothetical protein